MSLPVKIVRGKLRSSLALLALAGGLGLLLAAAPAPASRATISVGDFAVLVASHLSAIDPSQTALTPNSAVAALQRAGIKVRQNLDAPVTEGDAAEIFKQFDIMLSPRDSGSPLDPARAASLVGIFSSTLSARGAVLQGPGGKDLGGVSASSAVRADLATSIEDCQALPKTQDCQFCCRDLLGGSNNDSHTNRTCAKACNTKARNVSPSEPTP